MKEEWIDLYCPKCGEHSIIEGVYPGIRPTWEWMLDCPLCETTWDVRVEFYEVEKETDDASVDAEPIGAGDSVSDGSAEEGGGSGPRGN